MEINNDVNEEEGEEEMIGDNDANNVDDLSSFMDDDCSQLAKIYKELNSKRSILNINIAQKKDKIKDIEKNISENQRKQEICDSRIKKSQKELETFNELILMVSSTLSNLKKSSHKLRKSIQLVLNPH